MNTTLYKTYKMKNGKEIRVTSDHWPVNPLAFTEYGYSIKPPKDLANKIPPLLFFSNELFDPTRKDLMKEVFSLACFTVPGFPGYDEFRERFSWHLTETIR